MLIVGELINATRKSVKQMLIDQDAEGIKNLAKQQADNGADYIDVNAGAFASKEAEYLEWLVRNVQEITDKPCCLDSANGKAIEAGLAVHKGVPMINSISMDSEQQADLLPVIKGLDCKVIGLCMGDRGRPPETADDRVSVAADLLKVLEDNGLQRDNIYLDPLAQCLSTNDQYGLEFLRGVNRIMTELEGVHTICGLSNISYGMPKRKIVNRAFMVMAIFNGLDGAIMNPNDRKMMSNIRAAEALVAKDPFCEQYCNAYRDGMLEE